MNIVDFTRNTTVILLTLILHCYCKRRAHRIRLGQPVNFERCVTRDMTLMDIQRFYLAKEYSRESARVLRKRFKKVKYGLLTQMDVDERVCPICCENMEQGVKMSCDDRHIFHKDCIQLWLTKNRSCPMCKAQII